MSNEKVIAKELTLDQKIKMLEPKIDEETYLRPLSQVDESFYNEVIKDELIEKINNEDHKFENNFDYHIFKNGPIQLLGFIYKFEFNEKADRKSTRLNSSHVSISYAVFCLKKKITITTT